MTKRVLTDYFEHTVTTTLQDCAVASNSKSWLRSHFPYRESARDANNSAFFDLLDALNERQLTALLMLRNGKNIFVTGCAGTGKTLWMRAAIAVMQAMGKSIAVCATTSQAASNIDVLEVDQLPPLEFPDKSQVITKEDAAESKKKRKKNGNVVAAPKKGKFQKRKIYDVTPRTLHSWAGIGYEDFDPTALGIKFLNDSKFEYVKRRWIYTNTLFMDEVSMLAPKLFYKLDLLGQIVRKNSKPFGGIQVVIVADFFQLPPVVKKNQQRNDDNDAYQQQQQQQIEERQREAMERELAETSDTEKEQDGEADEEENRAMQQFFRERTLQSLTRQTLQLDESQLDQNEKLLLPVSVDEARCCFQIQTWHETIQSSIVFNEVFRQNNPIFIDILCELRRGIVSPENIARLETRTRYRLTNDLLDIAHRLFGGRNCEKLKVFISDIFQVARQRLLEPDDSDIFQAAHVDVNQNMSPSAPYNVLIPNWKRFEKHMIRTATEMDGDCESALIYLIPEEHVPASHVILVSEIEPTHIMSLVAQVESCNTQKLATIKSPSVSFSAGVSIGISVNNQHFSAAQEHFAKEFSKSVTPLVLKLKVGAQVILTCNIAQKFYNGRRGVVVGFMKRSEFETNFLEDAVLLGPQPVDDDEEKYPIVRFDNGIVARVGRHSWERKRSFTVGAKPVIATLTQFPLTLAFAITIHKSQGMTIGRLSVNLTRAFECGIPYVALSRGINLESIVIEQMDRCIFDGSQPKLLPPPVVVAFYDKLEKETEKLKICET